MIQDIASVLEQAPQIPGQEARFEIVDATSIKGVSAPHAILAFSKEEDAALCNIGYTLQTLDLYLQREGIGSLWMGMPKPETKSSDYQILLAFGKTDVPMRSGVADFSRREVTEIANEKNAVAEAARLAPSAVNFQPWKLEFSQGKVTVKYTPKGILKAFIAKMQKIDLGICLKHTVLALEQEGKTITSIQPTGKGKSFAVVVEYQS
jgi:hypothetical protein